MKTDWLLRALVLLLLARTFTGFVGLVFAYAALGCAVEWIAQVGIGIVDEWKRTKERLSK